MTITCLRAADAIGSFSPEQCSCFTGSSMTKSSLLPLLFQVNAAKAARCRHHVHLNLPRTSPKNSHGVRRGCADTLTFSEGNIRGRTSWRVCIHPYSVAKATSLAERRGGCASTRTLLRRQHPWPNVVAGVHSPVLCCPYVVAGVHPPVLCCEGNIRGRTSWRVCIHPHSVAKATSLAERRGGCASTRTLLRRQHPWPNVVAGVHPPVLCCEGNIRDRTSWRVCIHPYSVARTSWRVCIHPYSVAKATSVAESRGGCASTRTLLRRQHP